MTFTGRKSATTSSTGTRGNDMIEIVPTGKHRALRGFTLLELLVVIAIIIVLASITVAGFGVMASGRALGQSASTVSATLMQAKSYANRYNVRTRVLMDSTTVDDQARHYMIVEWYDSTYEPAGTLPNEFPDVAWFPLGTDHIDRAYRLRRANRDYLSGSVRFFPWSPASGAGDRPDRPVQPLSRDGDGITYLPVEDGTNQIHFVPSGAVGVWHEPAPEAQTFGTDNLQVGLTSLGERDVERKVVLVLRASGLTYIEDAYGEGDY